MNNRHLTTLLYLSLFPAACAAWGAEPATYLDFEGVNVHATASGPEVKLINEVMRDACPDDIPNTHEAWTECVVNLSFLDIKNICGKLGPQTSAIVDTLLRTQKPQPLLQNDTSGEVVDWKGCFWNSKSGSDMGTYRWHGTGSGWILTNAPSSYDIVSSSADQSSLSVFDSLPVTDSKRSEGSISLSAIYAYRLIPQEPGRWLATHAQTNQDRINTWLHQVNLYAPYCGSKHQDDAERPCTKLPSLTVVAASPTLLVVRSLAPQIFGYQVHGIFWKSVTGYDIPKAK